MTPYVIQQGDSMSKLAYVRGFDAKAVWQDPENAELAAKRKSMDLLCAGDVVQLPDSPTRALDFRAHTAQTRDVKYPVSVVCTYKGAEACTDVISLDVTKDEEPNLGARSNQDVEVTTG